MMAKPTARDRERAQAALDGLTIHNIVMHFVERPDGVCGGCKAENALAQALADERERAALIAEQTNDCCECGDDECCKGRYCRVAAAIRAGDYA